MKKESRKNLRSKRQRRVRAKVSGTGLTPRLCIYKSIKNMYAQLIDDEKGITIVSASLKDVKDAKNDAKGAGAIGEDLAKKAKKSGIESVVFDRSGYQYHGKIKAFAEGARKGGLKF